MLILVIFIITAQHMIVSKKDSGINTLRFERQKSWCSAWIDSGRIKQKKSINKLPINIENRNRIPDFIQEIKNGRLMQPLLKTVQKAILQKNKILRVLQ